MSSPRKRAQALARGRAARVSVPFAFEVAAQISARPLDAFRTDPTQLANGLLELHRAIGADGILCAAAGGMERESSVNGELDAAQIAASGRVAAALEACRRLRATLGDEVALAAAITGPATLAVEFAADGAHAATAFVALCKQFCEAGADALLAVEPETPGDPQAWQAALRTAGNVARFHRAALLLWDAPGPLPAPVRVPLEQPVPGHSGFVTTDGPVPAHTSIEVLRRWVEIVAR